MILKFRGKPSGFAEESRGWVYGFAVQKVEQVNKYTKEVDCDAEYYLYNEKGVVYLVDLETIGIKSDWSPIKKQGRNEVEDIYVGDILLDCINNVRYEVRWNNGIWCVNLENRNMKWLTLEELTDIVPCATLTIAGNIHDNVED